ncbi:MAG: type II toxin-antitoxin system HicA family toxin [Acidobacteria bacterium]|nr:type II toxin-antitoxin system HicA family toxin [Acidobacteriota bacterium]
MTARELKRLLKKHGVRFEEGTQHTVAILGDRKTTIPRHPSEEIRTGTFHAIMKELGLKPGGLAQ